jgi:hypothetical protein
MSDIYARIDSALEKAHWRKWKLRGIYLDPIDYFCLHEAETKRWQALLGGEGPVWPLSYENVHIIGGKALPVKHAGKSAVYAESGEAITIPKELSPRVRAA